MEKLLKVEMKYVLGYQSLQHFLGRNWSYEIAICVRAQRRPLISEMEEWMHQAKLSAFWGPINIFYGE